MDTAPPEDPPVAPALSAWLGALDAAESNVDFAAAAENCVPLCRVFALFAPHLLSATDFFVPAKNTGAAASRQRRYNTRRLARSLAEWYGVGSSRSGSPVGGEPARSAGPVSLEEPARVRIRSITDAARAEGAECDSPALRLALAELLLCAAVNSGEKKRFVEAILTLPHDHQEALAVSIHRTTSGDAEAAFDGDDEIDVASPAVLVEVRSSYSSDENAQPSARIASSPVPSRSAKPHGGELLVTPRGISHVEYRALAEERDALRKKLATAEGEKNKALELADALKRDLDGTCDRLRGMQGKVTEAEKNLEAKNTALSDAKAVLRSVHQSAEELDVLRAKAASSDQLEASLKRASKRLEEVADMRKTIKELEAQNAAYRDNEERMGKQVEYLESQLQTSNERAQSLVQVSDELSSELEAKTGEIRDITSKNQELNQKLHTANDQLAQMLMQPSAAPAIQPKTVSAEPEKPAELDMESVSKKMFDEVGVHMAWSDIVDCIRGVVEAMNEMDEIQRQQDVGDAPHERFTSSGHSSRSLPFTGDQASEGSNQSYPETSDGVAEKAEVKVLPDFALVDSKHEAQRGDAGDQFDYAVDHPNIMEIPVMNRRPSQLSTVPEDREGFESDQDDDVPEPETLHIASSAAEEVRDVSNVQPIAENYNELSIETQEMQSLTVRPAPQSTPVSSTGELTHTVHTSSLSVRVVPANQNGVQVAGHNVPVVQESRSVVRQTRSDLPIHHAMEALRMEQNAHSLAALIQQLTDARSDAEVQKAAVLAKEREVETLRHDLDSLIKEHDSSLNERRESRARDAEVMREKERVISLLERNLAARDEELATLRVSAAESRAAVKQLRALELQIAAANHEHTTAARAHEIEIARLGAKLEASELIADKLGAAMDKTDGLSEEIHKARESYFQDMADAARREKEAAELARAEAQRIADSHQRALAEIQREQQAAAVAAARSPSVCCSETPRKPRRARIGAFWRRMLHLDNAAEQPDPANGTVVGPDARLQAPHPALQAATAAAAQNPPTWDT